MTAVADDAMLPINTPCGGLNESWAALKFFRNRYLIMRSSNLTKCLVGGSILIASAATASPPQTPNERELERLSMEWMTAIERKDRKSLESFLAANY